MIINKKIKGQTPAGFLVIVISLFVIVMSFAVFYYLLMFAKPEQEELSITSSIQTLDNEIILNSIMQTPVANKDYTIYQLTGYTFYHCNMDKNSANCNNYRSLLKSETEKILGMMTTEIPKVYDKDDEEHKDAINQFEIFFDPESGFSLVTKDPATSSYKSIEQMGSFKIGQDSYYKKQYIFDDGIKVEVTIRNYMIYSR